MILMRRTPHGLAPHSAVDAEALDAYALGADVEVTIRQRRSSQHHRWFFKYLSEVIASGITPFRRVETPLDALKLECGYGEMQQLLNGEYVVKPASISFAAMDQGAFKQFAEDAIAAIATHYGVHPEQVMEAA